MEEISLDRLINKYKNFSALFNILLTALPPGAIGLFDQPVPQKTIHKYPFLYATFHELAFSDHVYIMN
jgi:hypothetical protein